MRRIALYAAASAGVIAGIWFLFSLAYSAPEARRALTVSAGIAFVVQLAAFALLTRMRNEKVMLAWTAGVITRFVVIALYGLIVLRAAGLPMEPALLSLATFFVTCTLIEPLLLPR